MKLLGTIVNDRLTWDSNCLYLITKCYKRMPLLHKMSEFGASETEMLDIYVKFIRSVLEYSCVVWGSSLTKENCQMLERVQKTAVKLIHKDKYKTYKLSLAQFNIDSLQDRRRQLALTFAKRTLHTDYGPIMFPENEKLDRQLRTVHKYRTTKCNTTRFQQSSIPFMESLLNEDFIKSNI